MWAVSISVNNLPIHLKRAQGRMSIPSCLLQKKLKQEAARQKSSKSSGSIRPHTVWKGGRVLKRAGGCVSLFFSFLFFFFLSHTHRQTD